MIESLNSISPISNNSVSSTNNSASGMKILFQEVVQALESQQSTFSSTPSLPSSFHSLIHAAASKYQVPANLIQAVIYAESNFNPNAVSSAGALGLMQLMPSTATNLGVTNAFNPAQNIQAGTQYLSSLLKKYQGNQALALAAYNAGPSAVDQYRGIPPYPETQQYVKKVLNYSTNRQ